MTNWPGAVLMLRHYRAKSLWEHITIMLLAMSQISELFFFSSNIGKTLGESESVSFLLCVFSRPEPERKTQFLGSQKTPLVLFFCLSFFLLLFFLQSRETRDATSCKAAKRASAAIKLRWNQIGVNQSVSCFLDKRET